MRWTPGGVSGNVEDRRGGGFRRGGGLKLGVGGLVIAGVLTLLTGQNFFAILGDGSSESMEPGVSDPARDRAEEPAVQFVSFVLDNSQNFWHQNLNGYRDAKLVLFRDAVQSGCGVAGAETGPFYCPADEKVYIDLSFFDELRSRFAAPGDFAQAYVLAHEIGHHVQTVLGVSQRIRQLQQRQPGAANQLSVAQELQADCFAGVWGHSAAQNDILEPGDLEEGLSGAAAVGDDRIQRQARGRVNPETFTHGTSEQRVAWFRRGFESGNPKACETLNQ
jgi:predicted metalloprotease